MAWIFFLPPGLGYLCLWLEVPLLDQGTPTVTATESLILKTNNPGTASQSQELPRERRPYETLEELPMPPPPESLRIGETCD